MEYNVGEGLDESSAATIASSSIPARRVRRVLFAHFEAALALGNSDTARLHEAIGDLQTLTVAYGRAAVSSDLAAARATPAMLPMIERKLGMLFGRQGEWERAGRYFEAALSQVGEVNSAERSHLLAARSLAAHRQQEPDRAWLFAAQALQIAGLANDSKALSESHNVVGMLARHPGGLGRSGSTSGVQSGAGNIHCGYERMCRCPE